MADPLVGVPRPTRVVAEAHRPAVLPGLVPEQPDDRFLSIDEALASMRDHAATGESAYHLLDRLHAVTGLPWDSAAELLVRGGIIRHSLDADSITMVARARAFWARFEACRYAYRAAANLRQIPPAEGEWGLVEADLVLELLPGFLVPRSAARNEYLVRVIRKEPHRLIDLDFHADSYHPLFTVPM